MSSCLSGGGRPYRLNLELIKSPSTSWTSHSSSPSSTLSESTNSPVTITTRKPRTPRKRPNQIYNEAAAILSKAYPNIFCHKHLIKPGKFTKPCNNFAYEVQDLMLPFQMHALDNFEFLLHPTRIEKPNISNESKVVKKFDAGEINSNENLLVVCDEFQEDFDAESILDDEEIEEGIDSIMGGITTNNNNESMEESKNGYSYTTQMMNMNTCYGYPVDVGYYGNNIMDNFVHGIEREAFRNVGHHHDWWKFSSVDITDITPELDKITSDKKKKKIFPYGHSLVIKPPINSTLKKKKKNVEKYVELKYLGKGNSSGFREAKGKDNLIKKVPNALLQLKLNYEVVLNAWSNRPTPLPEELLNSKGSANDVQTRLSKINLFTQDGGLSEASVSRYKENRRTRPFSKKIRYQVSKFNVDQRPRMKGRFVRRPDSPQSDTNEDIDITT
ncbi:hypothetical protein LIER_12896 [Lithospermum erythrorhizon]|uniref:CCT domain-containing protein n=1 Tax=Lithospermum erythrorhizon TaxID=34254 RepID=A0AAV3PTH0_LITER